MRAAHRFFLLTAAAAFIGCAPATDVDEATTGQCIADAECSAQQFCMDGACVDARQEQQVRSFERSNLFTTPDPISCLEAQPAMLDFGEAELGDHRQVSFFFVNCGETPVDVHDVFSDAPEFFVMSDISGFLEPGHVRKVDVQFVPVDHGHDRQANGAIVIDSTAPMFSLPLTAQREEPPVGCPNVVVEARSNDSKEWKPASVGTTPDSSVAMRARSMDQTRVYFEWTLAERPGHSEAELLQPPNAEGPSMHLDVAGRYAVQMMAYNEDGTCGTSRVVEFEAVREPMERVEPPPIRH